MSALRSGLQDPDMIECWLRATLVGTVCLETNASHGDCEGMLPTESSALARGRDYNEVEAVMPARLLLLGALLVFIASAARLPDWYERELADAAFSARLVRDASEIQLLAGEAFDGEVILVEVRVRPLYGSKVTLHRDDFLIRARNTNETSPAQSPQRIAGSEVLAFGSERKNTSSGGIFGDPTNAPVWGGAPGTGTRPRRIDGPGSIAGREIATEERRTAEQIDAGTGSVVDRLQALELPLQTEDTPVSGYLYFEIPAKIKRKHLELSYDGVLGEFLIEFKKPE